MFLVNWNLIGIIVLLEETYLQLDNRSHIICDNPNLNVLMKCEYFFGLEMRHNVMQWKWLNIIIIITCKTSQGIFL